MFVYGDEMECVYRKCKFELNTHFENKIMNKLLNIKHYPFCIGRHSIFRRPSVRLLACCPSERRPSLRPSYNSCPVQYLNASVNWNTYCPYTDPFSSSHMPMVI